MNTTTSQICLRGQLGWSTGKITNVPPKLPQSTYNLQQSALWMLTKTIKSIPLVNETNSGQIRIIHQSESRPMWWLTQRKSLRIRHQGDMQFSIPYDCIVPLSNHSVRLIPHLCRRCVIMYTYIIIHNYRYVFDRFCIACTYIGIDEFQHFTTLK